MLIIKRPEDMTLYDEREDGWGSASGLRKAERFISNTRTRKHVVSEVFVSIQGYRGAYCNPRADLERLDYYAEVEIAIWAKEFPHYIVPSSVGLNPVLDYKFVDGEPAPYVPIHQAREIVFGILKLGYRSVQRPELTMSDAPDEIIRVPRRKRRLIR